MREASKTFAQTGVHGQLCYVDYENDVVIVHFGSHELSAPHFAIMEDIFDPIIEYLKTLTGGGGKKKGKGGKGKGKR